MANVLYIGSTDHAQKFHVGMTGGRPPEARWSDSDYRAKLSYVPKRVKVYGIDTLRDEPVHKYILRDERVTSVKDEEGIRSDEIFRVNSENPAELLVQLVEEAIQYNNLGIMPIEAIYEGRPHQEWVNARILDRYDGSRTVVQPANLCARFGKTLAGLDLFKKSGLQVMVVASYWLSANQSFVSTVLDGKFDITCDVAVIKPIYSEYKAAIERGQRVLIDASLHQDASDLDQELISALSEVQSLVYVDEADFGAWTTSSRESAAQYINTNSNLVIVATGTNIDRALIGSTGTIEEPITVSYLDLIEAKRGEGMLFSEYQPTGELESAVVDSIRSNPTKWSARLDNIVEVACLNLEVNPELATQLNTEDATKRPNMTKVFSKSNNQVLKSAISDILFNEEGADVFGLYEAEYGSIESPALMVFIPGTKADVNNMVKVGKTMTGDDYNWVALHGDDYTNRKAEGVVKDIIGNGTGYRTVIVSCSMGARSFSVPNIIGVVNCIDGGSIGTSVQRSSRCLTPGMDKLMGLIVNYSFNSARSSSFETDLISSALDQPGTDTDGAIRRVYRLANFFKKDEFNYLTQLSEVEFSEYVTSPENIENMAAGSIDINGLLSNEDLLKALSAVGVTTENKEWSGVVEKATTYISSQNEQNKEVDTEAKAVRDLIRKIMTIIKCTGNVHYLAPNANSFEECLGVISTSELKEKSYTNLVGISAASVLSSIIDFLPLTFMDLIVQRASSSEDFKYADAVLAQHQTGLIDMPF